MKKISKNKNRSQETPDISALSKKLKIHIGDNDPSLNSYQDELPKILETEKLKNQKNTQDPPKKIVKNWVIYLIWVWMYANSHLYRALTVTSLNSFYPSWKKYEVKFSKNLNF